MKMPTNYWIDLCHTKARYYQTQALELNDSNYLSDSKAWLAIATHLGDVLHEQLATPKHTAVPLDL